MKFGAFVKPCVGHVMCRMTMINSTTTHPLMMMDLIAALRMTICVTNREEWVITLSHHFSVTLAGFATYYC
jgi:hypothetical protein